MIMRLIAMWTVAGIGLAGCGGGGGGGGAGTTSIEIWTAALTGSGYAGQCSGGDKGTFAEGYTFTVQYPGSLSADIAAHASGGSSVTFNGGGLYAGEETVSKQSGPGICVLEPTIVNSATITAETFYTAGMGPPQYRTFVRSAEILVGDKMYYSSTGVRSDVPASVLILSGTSYAPTQISGTWMTNQGGNGNAASGPFTMSLLFSGSVTNLPGPTGVAATPGARKVRLAWNPVNGAIGYKIRYAPGSSVPSSGYQEVTGIRAAASPTYDVGALTANQPYTFVVIAVFTADVQSNASSPVTATPMDIVFVTKVDAGFDHTCAIQATGTVRCWGSNAFGQLGADPGTTPSGSVVVAAVVNPIDVVAGRYFSCAIDGASPADTSGPVKCWGAGGVGQLGNNATASSASPVTVNSLTTAVQLSAFGSHACALLANGQVMCWGAGTSGQLGNGFSADSAVPVAATGIGPDNYALAPATTKAHQVSAGEGHTCARVSTSSGSAGLGVKCWGASNRGELGNGAPFCQVGTICDPKNPDPQPRVVSGLTDAAQLAVGGHHSCVVTTAGGVRCWGMGDQGQLGNNQTLHSNVPVTASGLSGATHASAGAQFSCASASGALRCWGRNDLRQLGNDGTSNASVPAAVTVVGASTYDPASLSGGEQYTCVKLTPGGSAFCFP